MPRSSATKSSDDFPYEQGPSDENDFLGRLEYESNGQQNDGVSSVSSLRSSISNDETLPASEANTNSTKLKSKDSGRPVSWRDLPHRGQLSILTAARLSEPLTQTSLNVRYFVQLVRNVLLTLS